MGLTILEGSTFCICDEIGDLDGRTSGLFAEDTRVLARLELRIDGARPLLLSSGKVEYFSAAFYMRNPPLPGLPQDTLSISRARFVGPGMQDHLVVRNEGNEELSFELGLEVGTDFADIISVKEHDFALGNPLLARPLPDPAPVRFDAAANQLVLDEERSGGAKTQILLSRRCEPAESGVRFQLRLPARASWDLRIDIVHSFGGDEAEALAVEGRFGEEREHVQESLAAWRLRVPRLQTRREDMKFAFRQSVADLAALRMRGDDGVAMLPAAGMPWFMTVFGRDTIITCLQSMLLGPGARDRVARRTCRASGARGRPVDRRRAGQDRPRTAPWQGGRDLVRALLRHPRRDSALPRPPVRGLALDGRRGGGRAAARAGARGAELDRRVRRP